jgi:hypothetical protein
MRLVHALTILAALSTVAALPASASILLQADFSGHTPGATLGVGGAAAGEPVAFGNCTPVVVDAPLPGNAVAVADTADYGTGTLTFEWLAGAEITSGVVTISTTLWFDSMDRYAYYVREHGSSAKSFATIMFQADGDVYVWDAAGVVGAVAAYTAGTAHLMQLVYDMNAGTYDVLWDGALVLEDRAHGIADRGIGRVIIGFDHDADVTGIVYFDDLIVELDDASPVEESTWTRVKDGWR